MTEDVERVVTGGPQELSPCGVGLHEGIRRDTSLRLETERTLYSRRKKQTLLLFNIKIYSSTADITYYIRLLRLRCRHWVPRLDRSRSDKKDG